MSGDAHQVRECSDVFTIRDELRAVLGKVTRERPIGTPQSTRISIAGHELLNFCANAISRRSCGGRPGAGAVSS
ncbi:hypothetical protein ACIA8C_35715 [Nocardia sp. NPDC051321]|uniref:hypothetical protein n=1 Tax=Nocardia sp. NPDC051321 TaxID=3364323 RepID=UPI0037A271DF